jgi:hypothetical protein
LMFSLFIGSRAAEILSAAHSLLIIHTGTIRFMVDQFCRLLQWRDRHGIAAGHGSRVLDARLNRLWAALHIAGACHGGIHVVGHAGNGCGLVAQRARRNRAALRFSHEIPVSRRSRGGLDLAAGGARRKQGVTGVDIDGDRGQSGHADGHKEVSSFHILFFNFWRRFIAPPNAVWVLPRQAGNPSKICKSRPGRLIRRPGLE